MWQQGRCFPGANEKLGKIPRQGSAFMGWWWMQLSSTTCMQLWQLWEWWPQVWRTWTNIVTCPLHALAYEIECCRRANHASEIIDPKLGRGHSNACEATFCVFPKFHPKDTGLERLHYQTSMNLALVQASMTYLYKKRGPEYHWILDLFQRMGLPVLDGMKEQVCCCQ